MFRMKQRPSSTVENLKAQIANRDAIIQQLENRVDEQNLMIREGRKSVTFNAILILLAFGFGFVVAMTGRWHGWW